MRKFGKRRMCVLLCGLSSVFCDFGQALAKVVKVVEKNQVEKTFAEKGYEWVMNNKKKSLLLTALLADSAWRGINEIRLYTIYKKLDKHYENGGCSASVERYVYRNKENSKNLVIKSINRLALTDYISFGLEQLACEVIPGLAKENKHLANIIDYHYGLTHNYVVYEDVGANHDWENEMKDWNDDQKFEWLEDVINQMVDVNLFLYDKGYYHGDFKLDNLSIVGNKDDGKPLVKIFDYGLFHRVDSILGVATTVVDAASVFRFPTEFFNICSQVLLGAKHVRRYGQIDGWWNKKKYDEAEAIEEKNQNILCEKYAGRPLIQKIVRLWNKVDDANMNGFVTNSNFRRILSDFRNGVM